MNSHLTKKMCFDLKARLNTIKTDVRLFALSSYKAYRTRVQNEHDNKRWLSKTGIKNKVSFLMFLLIGLTLSAGAQVKTCQEHFKAGIDINKYVNGNGHGGFYNISGVVNSHRSTVALGINWQKAGKKFNGFGLTYTFTAFGANTGCDERYNERDNEPDEYGEYDEQYDGKEELNFFCMVNYYKSACLSSATINAEGVLSNDQNTYYKSLRLNTVELFVGMGYNFWVTENFKLKSFIGVGVYNHMGFTELMFHGKMAPVLMTGIGIGFLK